MMDPRRLAAALVDAHPTLWVEAPDESTLLAQLAKVGPLPQADLFEPWEEGEPWRARAVVPGADPAACLAVGELLPGNTPGRSEWLDCGRVGEDPIEVGDATASCPFDHEGGLLFPDLLEVEDDDVAAVLAAFAAGVGGKSPVWVQAVAHRDTGRPGLRFTAEVPDREPLEERRAVIEAALGCGEPLAPDLIWWFELGRVVVVAWRIHPRRGGLPPDAGFGWSSSLEGWEGRRELQVVLAPASHDDDALALGEQLGEHGFVGSRARWIDGVFVAVWEGDARVDLELQHRVVPGCPLGLEDRWLGVDPRWWPGHLVRYRCGLADRDLLPVCTPREVEPVDQELIQLFGGFLQLDPVQADVPALRLVMPTLDARAWALFVEQIAALEHAALASVHYVAMGQQTTVLLRRQGEASPVPWGPREATR